MKCPNCGNELHNDDRFCNKCGYEIKLHCPNCGEEIDESDVFCQNCGQRLKRVEEKQETPIPVPEEKSQTNNRRREQHQATKSKVDYKTIGIIAGVVIILLVAVYFLFIRKTNTVDTNNDNVKVVETEKEEELTVDKTTIDIDVDETYEVEANLDNVKYESEDDNIASVNSKGEIKGIKKGITKVYVTKGKQEVTIDVYVDDNNTTNISGDYVFENSNNTLLTETDLSGKSAWELRIARNEIYARHGRSFDDATLRQYFESKSWYHVSTTYTDDQLSSIEKKNAEFIRSYETNHQ